MKKLLPYVGAGAAAAVLIFILIKVAFPGTTSEAVKDLQEQVAALRVDARALQDSVAARDQRIATALEEIRQIDVELDRVRAQNSVIDKKLNESGRIREKSDIALTDDLNRAHGSGLLKASGTVPR